MGSAVAAAAFGALMTGAGVSDSPAQAAIAPQERSGAIQSYRIPAGSVASALNVIADENDLHVLYDARLTHGRVTPGLSGKYSVREALGALLAGTGLTYEFSRDGQAVSIVLAQNDAATQNDASGAAALPPIDIGAQTGRKDGAPSGGRAAPGPGDRYTGYNAASAPATLKTDTPLLKTPIAIEVVTRQTMDDQQAISVGDALLSNVSGVTPVANAFDLFKIRGFYNPLGNGYKNGLMEYHLRNLDTTNLQSVEVLKGPAAMLFGRGEPGGIVNLVVKRPLETPYYSVQQQVKSFNGTRTTLDATGPLTQDKAILYRFNGEFYSTDSYRDFVSDRNLFLAPTISIRPFEQFRMNIDFEYQNRTYVDDYAILPAVGGGPANIPISRYLQMPSIMTTMPDHIDRKRIAYDWTWDFAPDWSLTNRLGYYNIGTRNENVTGAGFNATTGVLTRLLNYFPGYTDQSLALNLDLKGKFATGPLEHSILVGYDYFATIMPYYNYYFLNAASSINIYAPSYTQLENPYRSLYYGQAGQKWTGVYGQDMISFLDDTVHVLLGGRYDWTETGSNKVFSSLYAARNSYVNNYAESFSPRVGVVYQPLPWLSLYGNFTQSFGANNGLTNRLIPLAPQKGEQFEGGLKAELLDKRLTLTMAYFDIHKTNIPYTDPTDSSNTLLIGKARSQGFEFDLTGRIDDNWSVIANYTHDDVRTVQGASSYNPLTLSATQLAVAGTKLPASPRNYGNLWVKYDADGQFDGLSLGGGVTVVESSLGDNANSFVLPGYTLVNGMIAYTAKVAGYTVTGQLNVKNIGNVVYYPTSTDRYTIMTGAPRTFLGSLRVEF
ncbi:TonB-dependent siderophore receptor [Methylosinus sporium]|uniref:TonB-dependent siderophore receptor n=1 Tax=Methylosinus sporium TaxID=428 RepID=UPI00383AC9E6